MFGFTRKYIIYKISIVPCLLYGELAPSKFLQPLNSHSYPSEKPRIFRRIAIRIMHIINCHWF